MSLLLGLGFRVLGAACVLGVLELLFFLVQFTIILTITTLNLVIVIDDSYSAYYVLF